MKSKLKLQPPDQLRIEFIKKAVSRMCSDKADISLAILIEMLYSTCIRETGTVKVFDLNGDIICRVNTTNW